MDTVTTSNCSACGGEHTDIPILKLPVPVDDYTHAYVRLPMDRVVYVREKPPIVLEGTVTPLGAFIPKSNDP